MPLALTYDSAQSVSGRTYFSDPMLGQWPKQTGIYMPPSLDLDRGVIDMLIYLHGYYVTGAEQLLKGDPGKMRQQVLASGKNVVLVAPFLGNNKDGSYFHGTDDIKGRWGQYFIDTVIDALAVMTKNYKPQLGPPLSMLTLQPMPALRLRNLIVACHSGGGVAMRKLVKTLGRYRSHLAEVWGFDCMYTTHSPSADDPGDDATFWYNWSTAQGAAPLFVSFAGSTVPQSVKLYMMGQGFANERGGRRYPELEEVQGLEVRLGVSSPKNMEQLVMMDDLLQATTQKGARPPQVGEAFVDMAIGNVRRNVVWPGNDQAMAAHYAVASNGLLERLKAASYL